MCFAPLFWLICQQDEAHYRPLNDNIKYARILAIAGVVGSDLSTPESEKNHNTLVRELIKIPKGLVLVTPAVDVESIPLMPVMELMQVL